MAYEQAAAALGDPTRRQIFESLRGGPRSVGEIAETVPVSRPAVSQHLKVLKGAGLVKDERQGTRRLYAVNMEGLTALRSYLDSFWDDALAAFKTQAESDQRDIEIKKRNRRSEGRR